MVILFSNQALLNFKSHLKNNLAFVPTMGAIHEGHLTLVKEAKKNNATALVSIFVNPLQFNNPEDLLKYPKTIQKDLELLNAAGADAVFIPEYETLYPKDLEFNIALKNNSVESVFEGYFRPGHFHGVIQVLHRFFTLVKPNSVFFGQKDLQQCMVVKILIEEYFNQIQFNIVPTVRETSGLAMSSRNLRLSAEQKQVATEIYKILNELKNSLVYNQEVCNQKIQYLNQFGFKTEYLSFVNLPTMDTAQEKLAANQAIVYAGYLGDIRLIDNLLL